MSCSILGESTLLKILSRITRPTEGRAIIDGRVALLLEPPRGTGFHQELTGRDELLAAKGWPRKNDAGERRWTYDRLERENCRQAGTFARV